MFWIDSNSNYNMLNFRAYQKTSYTRNMSLYYSLENYTAYADSGTDSGCEADYFIFEIKKLAYVMLDLFKSLALIFNNLFHETIVLWCHHYTFANPLGVQLRSCPSGSPGMSFGLVNSILPSNGNEPLLPVIACIKYVPVKKP